MVCVYITINIIHFYSKNMPVTDSPAMRGCTSSTTHPSVNGDIPDTASKHFDLTSVLLVYLLCKRQSLYWSFYKKYIRVDERQSSLIKSLRALGLISPISHLIKQMLHMEFKLRFILSMKT